MENYNHSFGPVEPKRPAMERSKYIFAILTAVLLFFTASDLSAQSDYSKRIYRAYITGDMDGWSSVIRDMETRGTPTAQQKLELAGYYYGHIGYLIGSGERREAKAYIRKAENLVENVLAADPNNATALSYKGVLTAYKMSLNKAKAPILGPQTMRQIKRAYEADPGNPQALSDMGNMFYHAPGLFGGDKKLGTEYIARAVRRIEELGGASENWYYLNLMVLLAQYLEADGRRGDGVEVYEKILQVEPDFSWVRDELYPAAKRSIVN